MRILVMSDSHGNYRNFEKAIISQPGAEAVFFLGDGFKEFDLARDNFKSKSFHGVKGNCDSGCGSLCSSEILNFEGIRMFLTHGANENVKASYTTLALKARSKDCQIALFGHTHISYQGYDDGLYLLNPGSIHMSRNLGVPTYGIIDITPQGIFTNIVKLRT